MPADEYPISGVRHDSWVTCRTDEASDAIIAALARGGVERLFFVSGSDIVCLQEAAAKARARGFPTPVIETVLHENVGVHAAIGSSMVSGAPTALAVHVDVGLLNTGAALHTASAGGYPVVIMSGSPARAYPGSMRGARDHLVYWQQEPVDQRVIAGPYSKWAFRLEMQDNPGLVVSRALQVALSPPAGPVFLSLPREVAMAPLAGAVFPSAAQLGRVSATAPSAAAMERLADWLATAERPLIITGRSGKDPRTVAALVRVAELAGIGVTDSGRRERLNFPTDHPLMGSGPRLADADVVVVLDRKVPWIPDPIGMDGEAMSSARRGPVTDARIAWICEDPLVSDIAMLEFPADLRIASDPYLALLALGDALESRLDDEARSRARRRCETAGRQHAAQRKQLIQAAMEMRSRRPIAPSWLAYQLATCISRESILLNDALSNSDVVRQYFTNDRPGSYFTSGSSGGGWGVGAAFGAKLAAPERDVVLASGDGYYGFGVPSAALWSAVHSDAPYLSVIFVNGRYSTGTTSVDRFYPDGYAARSGYPGGRFSPPPDFAAQARAAGAYGEYVKEPGDVSAALRRGLAATHDGQPAVVAVEVA